MDREFGQDFIEDIFKEDTEEETQNFSEQALNNGHRHTIDGSICHTCKIPHQVPFDEDLNEQDEEQILTFLDTWPDQAVKKLFIDQGPLPQARVLGRIIDWLGILDSTNETDARIYGIYEYTEGSIEEHTNGTSKSELSLTKTYEKIYVERQLINAHIALQQSYYQKDFMRYNQKDNGVMDSREMTEFLSLIDSYFVKRLESCRENYKGFCKDNDITHDQNLIDYGIFEPKTLLNKKGLYKNIDSSMSPKFKENLLNALDNASR